MKLATSLLAALRYSDKFSHPLTLNELLPRLVRCRASRKELKIALQELVQKRRISQRGEYYYLSNHHRLVPLRLRREQLAAPLLVRARALSRRLSRFPGVLSICLTGSLAVGSATRSSDIDLMIITAPHRLWTTRLLLTLYTSLLQLRRSPHSHRSAGLLCLNLYLTPTSLALPSSKQGLYSAYELIQSRPLYDPLGLYPSLLAANSWLSTYLPNFKYQRPHTQVFFTSPSLPLLILETICYHLQSLYMARHRTSEYITADSAYFHPHKPPQVK